MELTREQYVELAALLAEVCNTYTQKLESVPADTAAPHNTRVLSAGQVYQHKPTAALYMIVCDLYTVLGFDLVCLSGNMIGKWWKRGRSFDGDDADFEYVGMFAAVFQRR